jgi:hypothetical protein
MALMQRWFGYYYYATPDYEDCLPKTVVACKLALAWGAVGTAQHLLMAETRFKDGKPIVIPKTWNYAGKSVVRYTGPVMGICFLSSSISCALANLRGKKDDPWNHILSWGPVTGLVLTKILKNSGYGFGYGLIVGLFAGALKIADNMDYVIIDTRGHHQRKEVGGALGGDDWGDMRFWKGRYEDPGRRPNY